MSKNNTKNGITLQKKHIIIIIIIILLLLISSITLGVNWNKWFGDSKPKSPKPETNASLDIDPNAGDWKGKQPEDKGGADVGIKIPGYPSITIAKDTKDVTMALLNPEGNPCYFKFELVLKDTNETIYESKYVPPGQSIYDVTLTKPLSEGEYPAIIKISTVALDQETALNGANVETVLIAK